MSEIRTRFAPSPTGNLHIGGLRTALYAFLFARKNNGRFILRIEDTDRARTVEGALENIIETLNNFKLVPDEGPIKQSDRLDLYKKYAVELIEKKVAYYCFCSPDRLSKLREEQQAAKLPPKYDKHCLKLSGDEIQAKLSANEPHVIRLNVPADRKIKFTDLVHGDIEISSNDIDDQVLLKSDGFPTYHLAVVVDDHDMKVSHVIRGDEWIASMPKHVLLYEAFGWPMPAHAHLPLLLSTSKKKLSKRDGDVAVQEFVDKGYLPEALLNFVVFLGWNPKTEQEIFSLEQLIQEFSFEHVNRSGAVFDLDKLDWFNAQYIRKLSPEDLYSRTEKYLSAESKNFPREFLLKVLKLEQERLRKLSEIGERTKYFFAEPEYDPSLLIWKKSDKESIKEGLEKLRGFLKQGEMSESAIKTFIETNKLKTGEVLWPLRVALSGLEASPGPFEIMEAFLALPNGKEIILKRIDRAMQNML